MNFLADDFQNWRKLGGISIPSQGISTGILRLDQLLEDIIVLMRVLPNASTADLVAIASIFVQARPAVYSSATVAVSQVDATINAKLATDGFFRTTVFGIFPLSAASGQQQVLIVFEQRVDTFGPG